MIEVHFFIYKNIFSWFQFLGDYLRLYCIMIKLHMSHSIVVNT